MLIADESGGRPLWQTAIFFFTLVALLIFATWGTPGSDEGFYNLVHSIKWPLTGLMGIALGAILIFWFGQTWWKVFIVAVITAIFGIAIPNHPEPAFGAGIIGLSVLLFSREGESHEWLDQTWALTKQIAPLLLYGVLVSGALLGRSGNGGLIPSQWVASAVGGNSFWANFFASIVGAFMYFATLTEVPIVQGLLDNGMGKGPALALLLAGPALSLPSMLVIASVMGWKKTTVYVSLVVIMATITGLIFGYFVT